MATVKRGVFRPHKRVTANTSGPSRTRQEFRDECDINVLMKRYQKTGVLPVYNAEPRYLDCAEVPNFQDAMQLMLDAEASFNRLPAVVRRDFDNDPTKFVEYAVDPQNLSKMREWGLAEPEKAPDAPMKVEVINPRSPAPSAPTQ